MVPSGEQVGSLEIEESNRLVFPVLDKSQLDTTLPDNGLLLDVVHSCFLYILTNDEREDNKYHQLIIQRISLLIHYTITHSFLFHSSQLGDSRSSV